MAPVFTYDTKTGEVYINAQKVRPHEVLEVMLHEVVGHKGLRSVFKDENLDALLDQVYREHFNDDDFKEVAARYFDPVEVTDEEDGSVYLDIDLQKVEDQRIAAEEYIAHLAEKEVKPSWWKELLQRIRMAFSRLPHFKEVRMTDDQINILLARASRKMRRGMFDRKSVVLADGNTQLTDGDFRYAAIGEKGDANLDNADSDIEPEISQAISKYKSYQAKEILKNIAGKPLNNIETGIDAQINTNQYNKMTSNAAVNKSLRNGFSRDKHFEALANIENLFKNAVLLEQTDDLKNNDNNVKIYRFASPFVIDNQIADVLLTVKRSIDNDAKRIYSLELIEIKKLSEKGSTTTNAQYYTDSILKLQQKHEKIKSFLENNANKLRFGVADKSDVSDELRFSIADYSLDEQSDIIDILTPYIGTVVDKTPAEIAAFLKERGVDIPENDAYSFAKEAARRKIKTVRKAADARRDNWLYENILEYKWAVDFAGSYNFKIRNSPRFEKIEKKGTFWVKSKDEGGNIISLEELAKHVSREYSMDELDVEQKLFDFYKDLTKPELRKNYTKFRDEQLAGDRAAARAAFDEFMQQEKFRIEDEAVEVLTAGQPVTEEWIYNNFKVYKELYRKLFNREAPGKILLNTGVPDLPIELSATQLKAKATAAHHPFNMEDIKDLPKMLQNPIGVFFYGDKAKAQNIIVEVQKEENNFIVGLSLNFKHDGLNVNSIRGLYPKDLHEWLTWIQKGFSLYLNKQKIQNLINQQRRNLADVDYINLDLIYKYNTEF